VVDHVKSRACRSELLLLFQFLLRQWLHHGKHCVLASLRLYKGLMLRDDDAQRGSKL
jgi:hypothetical protein